MNLKETLNHKYAELCKELGHLQSNADILAEKIAHIKVQIRTLNDFAKDVLKVSTNVPKIGTYDPKVGTPKDDSGELK